MALERLEFMATENVMNWQMRTTLWNSTSASVTARSAPSCARCHLQIQTAMFIPSILFPHFKVVKVHNLNLTNKVGYWHVNTTL